MRWLAGLMLLWGAAAMAGDACEEGARLSYPVEEVLRLEALRLHLEEYSRIDWDALAATGSFTPDGEAYREAVTEARANWGPREHDVRILALLDHAAGRRGDVMVNLTTASPSAVYDLFLEVLDRRALAGQGRAMRLAQAGFDPWTGTPESRRLQWTDGLGNTVDQGLLTLLKATSRNFLEARPTVMQRTLELVESDAALAEAYEAKRQAATDDMRFDYALSQIWDCADLDWWTPVEAQEALGKLPRPQRDLVVLNIYLGEAMNGSVHQFFYNSSGVLAPELAKILERHELPDHADSIRRGMAEYDGTYPVDTENRREQMLSFSEAKDNALYELTAWADDGEVIALMHRIVRDAGLWPE